MSRRPRKPSRGRTSRGRPMKTTVLLVGEGRATEVNYFDRLKRLDTVTERFAVTVKKGPGFNPERVVEEAIKHQRAAEARDAAYDECWCVLDTEGSEKRDSLAKARILANRHAIQLCLSNPSFEVWFLAHFLRTSRKFNDCEAVIVELNKHWPQVSRTGYDKSDEQLFDRLSNRLETALHNARQVRETDHKHPDLADCNSATEVYLLVEHFLNRG